MATPNPDHHAAPHRVPWAVHAVESALFALMMALLLEVVAVPIVPRLLLLVVGIIAFAALGITAQIRCWGALLFPAFTPARASVSVFIGVLVVVVTWFPDDAPLLWRAATTLVLSAIFPVLMRWDDARTVALLQARRTARSEQVQDAASPA